MTRYVLDANVFIQAKNLHYGLDFCPAFWEWLLEQNTAGVVGSIEKVFDELRAGGDDLAGWADQRGSGFFAAPDNDVVAAMPLVSQGVTSQTYEPAAIATFLQVADYWLIGHARAHSCTVVTHEVPSESTRKVKIPNVCVGMKLPCISPYEMLRRERARFVLGAADGR